MLIIGLTGGSGCGKGEFCRVFEKNEGCFCLDTDITARKVVEKGSECLGKLVEYFGSEILFDDGTLNRKKLAKIAFTDKSKHQKLNEITHFYIVKEINNWLYDMEKSDARAVVIDAPLLFESNSSELCHVTVGVLAPYDARLSRIINRDGIDEKNAKIRLDSQPSDDFFKERCNYILVNDTSLYDFQKKSRQLTDILLKDI